MKKKIFYIEDEPYLGRIVKDTLERKGYEVLLKRDGARIMETLTQFSPDICLLDVMLPHVDGFTLGNHIRSLYPRLPIIYLTAKTQTEDLLQGFSSGGNDYIKKPFSMEELFVRIENQLKLSAPFNENNETLPEELLLNKFRFYPARYELHFGEKVIRLSNRESQILSILCNHKNKPVDRKVLLHHVWGDDSFFNSRNLDVYIRKLRSYFEPDSSIEIITLKGIGYHFAVA